MRNTYECKHTSIIEALNKIENIVSKKNKLNVNTLLLKEGKYWVVILDISNEKEYRKERVSFKNDRAI